ncbi:MAG: DUF2974 domain-containing protein [Acholeplasmatales bacterium]|nr:DUF2974 domain-containing protein [Acholeplasmatales bacterium]
MANILDYINWRGDLTFTANPFNEIDNVILSCLSYIDYEDTVPTYPKANRVSYQNAVKKVFEKKQKDKIVLGLIVPKTIVKLMDIAYLTKRYGQLYVSNYINYIDKDTKTQFSAVVFHLNDKQIYISYRGTDDTLIGWQENIDMLYTAPTGAQVMGVKYLEEIAELYPNTKIYLGGHSKGGNIANYATIYAKEEIQDRIINCYTNDGQGMDKEYVDLDKYERVKDKIIRIIPENDVVGMIFDTFAGSTIICKSTAKGVYQHDPFSWKINVTEFQTVEKIRPSAVKLDMQLTKLIKTVPTEDKIVFGKNLYDFIKTSQLDTLMDCKKESIKLLKYLNKFNGKSKKIFWQVFGEFIFFK